MATSKSPNQRQQQRKTEALRKAKLEKQQAAAYDKAYKRHLLALARQAAIADAERDAKATKPKRKR